MPYLAPALCVVAAILFLIDGLRSSALTPFGLMALALAGAVVTT